MIKLAKLYLAPFLNFSQDGAAVLRCDDNASAAVLPEAWQAYARALLSPNNGDQAAAKSTIRRVLGAHAEDDLIWVSGGTEADALVLSAMAAQAHDDPIPHVITSTVEHPAIAQGIAQLEKTGRIAVTRIPMARSGNLDVDAVMDAIRPTTRLVSLVCGSNETGILLPVQEIAQACTAQAPHVVVHSDAVQVIGKMPMDVHAWGLGALSFSGHKVGAMGGLGALWVRRHTWLAQRLRRMQTSEHAACAVEGTALLWQMRGSLANAPAVQSLAAALALTMLPSSRTAIQTLRDHLESSLMHALADVEIIGRDAPRLGHVSSIRFGGCEGDGVMMALDLARIAVSTGSACSSGAISPSPVLLGMGLTPQEAKQVVRFSLAPTLHAKDIDAAVTEIVAIVTRMRAMDGLSGKIR